jgi:GTPase SAR1 family protein
MQQDQEELKIKIILLGDHGVGKTSIIDCIHTGPGDRQTIMTTGNIF